MSADSYTTLQLALPCTLPEATAWWEEVVRVMGDGDEVDVSVITHTDGRYRLTVHSADEVLGGDG